MGKERTFTYLDLYPELLEKWRQEHCLHSHIDYTESRTYNGKDYWADGKCFDCGKEFGSRIFWSTR